MNEVTQNGSVVEAKAQAVFWRDGRMIIMIFLAGSGIATWGYNIFLSPVQGVQQDIALIQQSIKTIETNHEAHMQSALQEISNDKKDIKELAVVNAQQNEQIVRILTILEQTRKQ